MTSLVTPLIWAIVVALTIWPRLPGRRLGFVVYVLTMSINELPLVILAVLASTNINAYDSRPPGRLGLAWWLLWGFGVVGLVWAQVRAARAKPAFEAAMSSALGPRWRESIDPDLAAGLRMTTPWWSGILLPFQRRRRGVRRVRDVAYGPDPAHKLDLYRGPTATRQRPIVIHFHGGGFVQGGKSRETVTLLNQLAAHGFLCLSVNYRLRENAAFPNPLLDAKRAIAWAREHAAAHDADPHSVFLIGGSAGGHLAVNAALTPGWSRFQPGFDYADTSVTAAISLYGYLGARSEDPTSEPASLAGSDVPALLLVQGTNDTALPAGMPPVWADSLRATSGGPVVYAELPGAQHAFDLFASVRARITADAVEAFLAWVRSSDGSA